MLAQEIAEVPGDEQTRADVVRRGHAQIRVLVGEFRRGVRPEDTEPAAEARRYARLLARRGVPLDVFLRIHRLSFGVFVRAFEERLDSAPSAEVLLLATRRSTELLFAQNDWTLQALSAEYQDERERFVRSADALRRETIQTILADQPVDLDRAHSVLRYDLRRHHIGLVLWAAATPDQPTVGPRLERAANAAADHFAAHRPLLLAEGTGTLWAWIGLDDDPDADAVEAFLSRANPDGVSVAVGEPAKGHAGFRQTHSDALHAARVARLSRRRAGCVVAYRTVELAALLSTDLKRARRFVLEQLGPLAEADDEMARLRATLLPYLEENGSRLATARRLGIHANTVGHRVRTCRELLGRDIRNRQVRLEVALGLAATLGPAILTDGAG